MARSGGCPVQSIALADQGHVDDFLPLLLDEWDIFAHRCIFHQTQNVESVCRFPASEHKHYVFPLLLFFLSFFLSFWDILISLILFPFFSSFLFVSFLPSFLLSFCLSFFLFAY